MSSDQCNLASGMSDMTQVAVTGFKLGSTISSNQSTDAFPDCQGSIVEKVYGHGDSAGRVSLLLLSFIAALADASAFVVYLVDES